MPTTSARPARCSITCSTSPADEFIVATEPGILHQMEKQAPHKRFIGAPGADGKCACNDCPFMALNTLEKLYLCHGQHGAARSSVPEALRRAALKPLERMLAMSPPAPAGAAGFPPGGRPAHAADAASPPSRRSIEPQNQAEERPTMQLSRQEIEEFIDRALAEDIGRGDLTTNVTVAERTTLKVAMHVAPGGGGLRPGYRRRGVPPCRSRHPGERSKPRTATRSAPRRSLARIEGNARAILSAERTALNIVQHLSGIATLTRATPIWWRAPAPR